MRCYTTARHWWRHPSQSWRFVDLPRVAENASLWSRQRAVSRVATDVDRRPGRPAEWPCPVDGLSASPSWPSHRSASRTRRPPVPRGLVANWTRSLRYERSSRAAARDLDVAVDSAAESLSSASCWPRWSSVDDRRRRAAVAHSGWRPATFSWPSSLPPDVEMCRCCGRGRRSSSRRARSSAEVQGDRCWSSWIDSGSAPDEHKQPCTAINLF